MPTTIAVDASATVFRVLKWRLILLVLFGILLAAQAPLLLFFASGSDGGSIGVRVLAVVLGLSIGGVGVWGIVYAVRRMRGGAIAISISSAGLIDSIVLPNPLPWSEMQRPVLRYSGIGGWRLMFDVDPDREEQLGISSGRRLVAARWRAVGARAYRVFLFGTDASLTSLRAALAPYVTVERPSGFSRILGRE